MVYLHDIKCQSNSLLFNFFQAIAFIPLAYHFSARSSYHHILSILLITSTPGLSLQMSTPLGTTDTTVTTGTTVNKPDASDASSTKREVFDQNCDKVNYPLEPRQDFPILDKRGSQKIREGKYPIFHESRENRSDH